MYAPSFNYHIIQPKLRPVKCLVTEQKDSSWMILEQIESKSIIRSRKPAKFIAYMEGASTVMDNSLAQFTGTSFLNCPSDICCSGHTNT